MKSDEKKTENRGVDSTHSINSGQADSPQVVTRFPPSPTGFLHIGSVRTALFNYLFAKQNNGKFILRIEDTDTARSKREFEDDIISGIKWLGISWDNEQIQRQSERKEIYKKYIEELLKSGKAYISDETEILPPLGGEGAHLEARLLSEVKYGKGAEKQAEAVKRGSVIRLKNPDKKISFHDEVRGEIEFDTTELGDFVIAKDEQSPLYHLAVVIDDLDMGITHVIRGEDHISNTPRQILIQEAIGAPRPIYAHIPLILGEDRSKMSKRHGATSIIDYKKQGYLPEAIVNFLALLGWNPGDDREIFTMEELVKEFSLEKIQKSGAVFNIEKLKWFNKHYIKQKKNDELAGELLEYLPDDLRAKAEASSELWQKIVALEKDRMDILSQIGENIGFFFDLPEYTKEKLVYKDTSFEAIKTHLQKIIESLNNMDIEKFDADNIKAAIMPYAEENGRGSVLWPMRMALSGLDRSPDPFSIAATLGKEEAVKRLELALDKLLNAK